MRTVRIAIAIVLWLAVPAVAADLQLETASAFDRYVRATEMKLERLDPFLRIDGIAEIERAAALAAVQRGETYIERRTILEAGKKIDVPNGLIHHWIGVVFVRGASVDQAVALMQDYDHHAEIFQPAIVRSRLLARDGNNFRMYLRFSMKRIITVVVNTENDARFTRLGPDRAQSRITSTRVAEVLAPDTPEEQEKPVGHDGGYLWRLYTYWRFLERDGGTYVQCEALSLTRGIPIGFGWLIGPFVTSIPRESLAFTLETTRRALLQPPAARP